MCRGGLDFDADSGLSFDADCQAGERRAGRWLFGFQRASIGRSTLGGADLPVFVRPPSLRRGGAYKKGRPSIYKGKCCALFWGKVRIYWVFGREIILCGLWECKRGYGW